MPIIYNLVKRSIFLVFVFMMFPYAYSAGAAEAPGSDVPLVTARAAALLDAGSGQVLFEKNARQKMPPASTTKIMTALLALEGGELQSTVTISPGAASVGEASLDLQAGEQLTLEDLIYGALLESGNDACVAIAEHVAGSEQNFVLLMNQKAAMIGAGDTNFKNTNGLPATGHYTTALDLAVITRYALGNPVFKEIVDTRDKTIGGDMKRYLSNTNRLLWSYSWADGVKTGTTVEAGQCLVASGTIDGRQLISVVLNSENRWRDSSKLLRYGYDNFEKHRVFVKGESIAEITVKEGALRQVPAVAATEYSVLIPKGRLDLVNIIYNVDQTLYAPVTMGNYAGSATITVNGIHAGSVALVTGRDVKKKNKLQLFFDKNFKPSA